MKKSELMKVYYLMRLARSFETSVAEQYTKGRIGGFCHLYSGEEAVAVGAMWSLRKEDYVLGSYRDHAYYIIRGGDPRRAMAELFGKSTGCCKGKGGSMHLFDSDINFLGGYAIVAGMCPIAVGLGMAVQYKREDRVVVCFFGDGATNQGVYHEALNMASLYKLPVVWVCENNYYAIGTSVVRSSAQESLADKARAYSMPIHVVDGMDFFKMQSVTQRAIAAARAGDGPSFIEAKCYRYRGHSMSDPAKYRSKEEVDYWKGRDPIPRIKAAIQNDFDVPDDEFEKLDLKAQQAIDEAVKFAEESEELPKDRLLEDLYVD
ncbi:MAG: pyruvate dehydrogenase (acetyl-transferring) E1 component subunit alpha [Phycisphaerae bacterium]|nr:pyruvate dehydrogenase (acetyl-transferring) E1 component subunit alpha [Phycisphaerae bacterium]